MMLIGCAHRSPEELILRAFSDQTGDQLFDQNAQPQYLRFADEHAAFLFKNLMRSGRYRLASENSSLLCPETPGEGMHGYLLDARVDTVMGDSAIGRLIEDCIRDPRACPQGQACLGHTGVVRMETSYLLVRTKGKWKVQKPLSGSYLIPM
jgi:hypothetical protein